MGTSHQTKGAECGGGAREPAKESWRRGGVERERKAALSSVSSFRIHRKRGKKSRVFYICGERKHHLEWQNIPAGNHRAARVRRRDGEINTRKQRNAETKKKKNGPGWKRTAWGARMDKLGLGKCVISPPHPPTPAPSEPAGRETSARLQEPG